MDIKDLRIDGRLPSEIRNIYISHGYENMNGFVSLSHGTTTVKATVLHPTEKCKIKFLLSCGETAREEPILDRKLFELIYKLETIFTPIILGDGNYLISLRIIQDNGSLLSALINATTLAMIYCGIPLRDICVAASCNERADLTLEEENKTYMAFVVTLIKSDRIIYFESYGRCQECLLENSKRIGYEACKKIAKIFENYFTEWDTPFKVL